jgi:dTDP-4-amino-4,6-dideoxygalactose transaminase
MIYYPIPQRKLKVCEHLNLSFPGAERAASEALSIPIWPEMGEGHILKVVEAVKHIFRL